MGYHLIQIQAREAIPCGGMSGVTRQLCRLLCSDVILTQPMRAIDLVTCHVLPSHRSVISYKTDEKPLYSVDTIANAGMESNAPQAKLV